MLKNVIYYFMKNHMRREVTDMIRHTSDPIQTERVDRNGLTDHQGDTSCPDRTSRQEKPRKGTASVRHLVMMITVAVTLVLSMIAGIGISSYFSEKTGADIDASDLRGFDAVRTDDHYTVSFGQYRQGEHGEIQPIEWRVLAVKGGRALVISEKLLNFAAYNDVLTDVTWETCSLRAWMNDTFYKTAFSRDEQEKIASVRIPNPGNSDNGINGGNETRDKLFALSIEETVKYFPSNKDRMAYITPFAHRRHLYEYGLPLSHWWLRSPGWDNFSASYVRNTMTDRNGKKVNSHDTALRPAMWLILD